MSNNSSSAAESLLGMMFDAVCVAILVLYRLHKQRAARKEAARGH